MKYRYHIVIFFSDTATEFRHSFNSNNEILWMSEIRQELKEKKMSSHGDFNVVNVVKTIND